MIPRRLTFQLTPLLDLLLIVIFAQFMEVRDSAATQERTSSVQLQESQESLTAAQAELNELLDRLQATQQELNSKTTALSEIEQTEASLKTDVDGLTRALEEARQQRETIARLLRELFDLPPETVAEIVRLQELTQSRDPERSRLVARQVEKLKLSLREFARKKPGEAVRHLMTFEELRKRCDIWDLYVQENGTTVFRAGDEIRTLPRVDTAGEFETALFDRYKSLPQPKGMVIVLLSYGNARASVYEAAIDGLPRAVERMQANALGGSRFEYAVLGYNPTPPERTGE